MALPPRLFKYQPYDNRSIDNLRRRAIWFSRPASFNDPFECHIGLDNELICAEELDTRFNSFLAGLVSESDRAEARTNYLTSGKPNQRYREFIAAVAPQYLGEYVQHALHEHGVACFSEVSSSILMWSHYAGGHRGFCLEFDTSLGPFSAAAQVRYREKLLRVSPIDKGWFGKGDNFAEMLTMKASCWAYEREWRLLSHGPDSLQELPAGCIAALHFGAAMQRDDKELLATILRGSSVRLYEFNPSRTAFKLESRPYSS